MITVITSHPHPGLFERNTPSHFRSGDKHVAVCVWVITRYFVSRNLRNKLRSDISG
jgi:hypothetical protein